MAKNVRISFSEKINSLRQVRDHNEMLSRSVVCRDIWWTRDLALRYFCGTPRVHRGHGGLGGHHVGLTGTYIGGGVSTEPFIVTSKIVQIFERVRRKTLSQNM